MTRVERTAARWSLSTRTAIGVAVGAVLAVGAAFVVWFLGFDPLWAMAAVLAGGPVGAVVSTRKLEDDALWVPSGRETQRGMTLLTVTSIRRSLAACDRLARPPVIRRLQALVFAERDDRLARLTLLRQLRAVLAAELHARGLDATCGSDEAVALLVGPDARAILYPQDDRAVTSAAIARCFDALDRLGATSTLHQKTS